nr:PREDICTED: leucine-rich repeat-containing protein 23 [Latimeria chalumnae]XP_014349221.1 PREDICTED: leucine-rich repeat-containing protein 23 [Latimeria chalumnae]|eukprot:XP_006004765.1 PREDICTED: leucine-rich repeat-containing protein 23 [Latimeria chalumnae]
MSDNEDEYEGQANEDEDEMEKAEGEEEEGKEDDEEAEEEKTTFPNPLTEEVLAEGLSLLCKTGNGLSHAYVRLQLQEKALTNIDLLRTYIHLRYVDVSGNFLRDLSPLCSLTQLLVLAADHNRLTSAKLDELPYLQVASFAYNRITSTEGLGQPMMETLNLIGNRISVVSGLDPDNLMALQTLELRGNKLETTAGICLPYLKNLYLVTCCTGQTELI